MNRKVRVLLPPMDAEQMDRLIEVLDLVSAALWTRLAGPGAPHRVELPEFRRMPEETPATPSDAPPAPLDGDLF